MKTFYAATRQRWRNWLARHHDSEPEVWLIFHKKHTGTRSVAYLDALDEALCYGWIDSLVKRIDDDRYARKFTPRKPESNWSSINIKRYGELKAAKRLAAPGIARGPEGRPVVDGPDPRDIAAVAGKAIEIEQAIKKDAKARRFFESLPPSQQRRFVGWIAMAKRDETRQARLVKVVGMLRAGRKPGLM